MVSHTLETNGSAGYHCPKCKKHIEETKMAGMSVVCPFCGAIF